MQAFDANPSAMESRPLRSLLKLATLGVCVLLLLVPVTQILALARERQQRQAEVRKAV